jgi:hypothetical protein
MILIYQMSKVASMAWVEAVRRADPSGTEPVHAHFLAAANLQALSAALACAENTIAHPLMARQVLRAGAHGNVSVAAARAQGQTIRIISGMRDPVARSLSVFSFFADFCGHRRRALNARDGASAADVCDALAQLWQQLLAEVEPAGSFERFVAIMIGTYRSWFRDELQAVFDLDALAAPCAAAGGGMRLHGRDVEAFIYRAEDLAPATAARQALLAAAAEFLGSAIDLPEVNSAATRRSYPLYRAVRGSFRLPLAMLDSIYAAPVVRQFYNPAEIAAFKARWQA